MARMTREFSLVLLGAGVLTAGSFFWPTEDLDAVAQEKADQQVAAAGAGGDGVRYRRSGFMFIWIPTSRASVSGGAPFSPARAGISRGGFGGVGAHVSGVS